MEETVLAYIEKDHSYLMLFRNKKKNDINEGKWIGVGGHIESGETPIQAVIREIKEETNLDVYNPIYKGKIYFDSDGYEEVIYVYKVLNFKGEMLPSNEGDLSFVSKDKLNDLPMWEGDKIFLPLLDEEGHFLLKLVYKNNHLVEVINKHNIPLLKKKIEATDVIFFDLDGTLIDTEPLYFRFWKEATKFYGYELNDIEALSMRSRFKDSSIQFLKDVSGGLLNYDLVKAKRIELMDQYLSTHPIEYKKGAYEFLENLHKQNKKIYIVTANTVEKAEKIIKEVGFMHLIDGVISAKDVKRGKPYPDVYLKACEVVNKSPKDVLVFEDSPNGLMSSYDAGCFTIMVEDMSEYNMEEYVDIFIHDFEELI